MSIEFSCDNPDQTSEARVHDMNRVVIYEATGADPRADRFDRLGPSGTITVVLVPDTAQVVDIASELVRSGARLVELCGGMPLSLRAAVLDAVGDRAKVSSVTFGIESIVPAAAYNGAFLAGKPPREALIILDGSAGPHGDRVVRAFSPQNMTLAFVPDEPAAAKTAKELANAGVGLIELYGGFSTEGAAGVIAAVEGKAPVGVGSFAYDRAAEPRGA